MNLTVGIAQYAPVVLGLKRSIDKACAIIDEAKRKHIKLLAFPETWIPVYPVWADMGTYSQWGNEQAKKLHSPAVTMRSKGGASCSPLRCI